MATVVYKVLKCFEQFHYFFQSKNVAIVPYFPFTLLSLDPYTMNFGVKHKKNIYQIISQFYNVYFSAATCILSKQDMGAVSLPLTVGKLQKEHISKYKRLYV